MDDNGNEQRKRVKQIAKSFEERDTKSKSDVGSKSQDKASSGLKPCNTKRNESDTRDIVKVNEGKSSYLDKEIRVVLLGKTGSGKSATGNSILGKAQKNILFKISHYLTSETRKCKKGCENRLGKKIILVDTPGIFDTELDDSEIEKEVQKCVGIVSPGPHAFILVLRFDTRFTNEEHATVERFISIFGKRLIDFLIVVFTRRDEIERKGVTVEEHMNHIPKRLKSFLEMINNRYVGFDNEAVGENNDKQVQHLISVITMMVNASGGSFFTSEMFCAVETVLQNEIEAKLKKKFPDKDRFPVLKENQRDYPSASNIQNVTITAGGTAGNEPNRKFEEQVSGLKTEIQNVSEKLENEKRERELEKEKRERELEREKRERELEREKRERELETERELEREKKERELERERKLEKEKERIRDELRTDIENEKGIFSKVVEGVTSTVGSVVGAAAGWVKSWFW